jgi:hypothetical protein
MTSGDRLIVAKLSTKIWRTRQPIHRWVVSTDVKKTLMMSDKDFLTMTAISEIIRDHSMAQVCLYLFSNFALFRLRLSAILSIC